MLTKNLERNGIKMEIAIDLIVLAIVVLSAILGYKKGLVKLGAKLFAGIIAIILTFALYKPVSNFIFENTNLRQDIENAILEKTNSIVENSENNTQKMVTETINNKVMPEQAKEISKNAVYVLSGIGLYIVLKILLSIVFSLLNVIANLPILKQFNETGGLLYGIIRGLLIVCIALLLTNVYIKTTPNTDLDEKIEHTYITKFIYSNIAKL